MTHLEGKTLKSLPVTLEQNTKMVRSSPMRWPRKHLPFPADSLPRISNVLVSPSLLREWMMSVLSLGTQRSQEQLKIFWCCFGLGFVGVFFPFCFFSFVVLSKQNTNEDVKHRNKETIMIQNRQSILKDKTRKAHLAILEILIKTVTTFQNQRLFWVTFTFVSTLSPLFWWEFHIWHFLPGKDFPGRQ